MLFNNSDLLKDFLCDCLLCKMCLDYFLTISNVHRREFKGCTGTHAAPKTAEICNK